MESVQVIFDLKKMTTQLLLRYTVYILFPNPKYNHLNIFNFQFELVCNRLYLAPLINTLYFCGVTMGALICGIWTDKYGRKTIMVLCLLVQGVLGILLRTTTMLELFIPMRVVQGFFVQVLHQYSTRKK